MATARVMAHAIFNRLNEQYNAACIAFREKYHEEKEALSNELKKVCAELRPLLADHVIKNTVLSIDEDTSTSQICSFMDKGQRNCYGGEHVIQVQYDKEATARMPRKLHKLYEKADALRRQIREIDNRSAPVRPDEEGVYDIVVEQTVFFDAKGSDLANKLIEVARQHYGLPAVQQALPAPAAGVAEE